MPVVLGVIAVLVVAWFFISRSGELFCVSIRDGKAILLRGRLPQGLLSEFRDVVKEPPVARGTIRAHRSPDGARLSASGIDDGRTQRLRNILGLRPIAQLRSAPVDPNRTFGQVLGVAWIAWLLTRR